ncbi:SGNH/GDSL hydrolase family protein [Clostridium lacusfryxellense]|uniref:SGNH/GDSL hydrolase family protein n=1 Tax=Clostridium lacusfryxellense TaxID=205328 RepID=UPI001C0ABBBF|nr:SGNH/GDSL hydrolase family protein [Clostridium lacusfryxellense]MBU3112148.1 SGNH/GDSL hydrolase family protein [Clostridium lacusfryxellense]
MELEVFKYRGELTRTLAAIKRGSLTIGFIGGSITDSRGRNRWPEPVTAWFVDKFPNVKIIVENAAIGATGSDLAVFRAKRDIITRNCDIIFVEFAVNDNEQVTEKRMRTRKGLLRKLLSSGKSDLVLTYTYSNDMYDEMINSQVPSSINEFEILANHYDISSVWMGLYALDEVMRGLLRMEEWVPDGLHPDLRGSYTYGQSVIKFLEKEIVTKSAANTSDLKYIIPEPYNKNNWEKAYILPLSKVELKGPWTMRRCTTIQWMDQALETTVIGAELSFLFTGRGLILGFDFGKTSTDFTYRIDYGEWYEMKWDCPDWCGNDGWYRVSYIGDDFGDLEHKFELKVIYSSRGTNFRLAMVGIVS